MLSVVAAYMHVAQGGVCHAAYQAELSPDYLGKCIVLPTIDSPNGPITGDLSGFVLQNTCLILKLLIRRPPKGLPCSRRLIH